MADMFDINDNVASNDEFEARLTKAFVAYLKGDIEGAKKIYDEVLEEDMTNLKAYLGLLRIASDNFTLFEGHEIDKNLKVIQSVFDEVDDMDYLEYVKKRDNHFKSEELFSKAKKDLDDYYAQLDGIKSEIEKINKETEEVLKANKNYKNKKESEAEDRAELVRHKRRLALRDEGLTLYKKGDTQKAAKLFSEAVGLGSKSPDVYRYLALAYVKDKRYEEAFNLLKIGARTLKDPTCKCELAQFIYRGYYDTYCSNSYVRELLEGAYDEGVRMYQYILAIFYKFGVAGVSQDRNLADNLAKEYIEQNKDIGEAWYNYSFYVKSSDNNKYLNALETAIKLDPTFIEAYYRYAYYHSSLNPITAKNTLDEADRRTNGPTGDSLAIRSIIKSDRDSNAHYLDDAKKLGGKWVNYIRTFGVWIFSAREDENKVRSIIDILLKNDGHVESYCRLAEAYERLKNKSKAGYYAVKAMEYGDDSVSTIHYWANH